MITHYHNFPTTCYRTLERREGLFAALSDIAVYSLVFLLLFFSENGNKPLDFEKINIERVASALMPAPQELPYRAPLRAVTFRNPVVVTRLHTADGWSSATDLWAHLTQFPQTHFGVLIRETLECGHKLDVYPGDHEPLIAKRRRCGECLQRDSGQLPRKKGPGRVVLLQVSPDVEEKKRA